MPDWLKGILIFVFSTLFAIAGALFMHAIATPLLHVIDAALKIIPVGFFADLVSGIFKLEFLEPFGRSTAIAIGAAIGALYGLEAALLIAYDLNGLGWLELLLDLTWSLPNTAFGLVFGNLIYAFRGSPSSEQSKDSGWIVYSGELASGVAQTLGPINIGGEGKHERVHLWQARLFGPFYLPLFGVNYVVNFILQIIWTLTVGGLLYLLNVRNTPYFRPGDNSAVGGDENAGWPAKFFGWMYWATLFEAWAYATE